jgi:hypothetical protein
LPRANTVGNNEGARAECGGQSPAEVGSASSASTAISALTILPGGATLPEPSATCSRPAPSGEGSHALGSRFAHKPSTPFDHSVQMAGVALVFGNGCRPQREARVEHVSQRGESCHDDRTPILTSSQPHRPLRLPPVPCEAVPATANAATGATATTVDDSPRVTEDARTRERLP